MGPVGTGPADPYSGKLRFIEKPGLQDEGGGGRHVAIRCSDPRPAYPEVKLQRRDLMRVVGVVAPFCPTRRELHVVRVVRVVLCEGRIWDLIVSFPDHCLSFYSACCASCASCTL